MNSLNQEILNSIDIIDELVLESEMNVIDSMINTYSKSLMILENYEGDSISDFYIFQEGFIMESDNDVKKENIIVKILMFIPRLIMKLVQSIKKAWDNRKSQQFLRRIEALENLTEEQKKQIDQLQKGHEVNSERISNNEENIEKNHSNTKKLGNAVVNALGKRDEMIDDLGKKFDDQIKDVHVDIKRHSIENERLVDIIDVMNGVVKTHIDFKKINEYYRDILSMFDMLENWDIHKPSTLSKESFNRMNNDLVSGRSTDGHVWVLGGKEYKCKYSDITKYIEEWYQLRDDISSRGKSLASKIENMGKEYRSSIKKEEPNKAQQDKLNGVEIIVKYIQNVVKSSITCDRIVSSHLNHIDALLKKYDNVINPKH